MLWIWLGVIVVSAIVEFTSFQMVSIWFTAGGIAAIIPFAAGADYWVQILVFLVVSFVFLFCFRRIALKWLMKNMKEKTNSEALIGVRVRLTSDLAEDHPATATIGDVVWTIVGKDGFTALEGTHVIISDIDGNKLVAVADTAQTAPVSKPNETDIL